MPSTVTLPSAAGVIFVLTLLRLADEIAATDSIKAPSAKGLRDNELALAARLVDGLAGTWNPEQWDKTP